MKFKEFIENKGLVEKSKDEEVIGKAINDIGERCLSLSKTIKKNKLEKQVYNEGYPFKDKLEDVAEDIKQWARDVLIELPQ